MEDYAMMNRGGVNSRFDIPAGMHAYTANLNGTGQSALKLNSPIQHLYLTLFSDLTL